MVIPYKFNPLGFDLPSVVISEGVELSVYLESPDWVQ